LVDGKSDLTPSPLLGGEGRVVRSFFIFGNVSHLRGDLEGAGAILQSDRH